MLISLYVLLNLYICNCHKVNNEKLCDIRLALDQDLNEMAIYNSKNQSDQVVIYSDTSYSVLCVTKEQVRSRNFISLISLSNESVKLDELDENLVHRQEIIANKTLIEKSLAYMSAQFSVSSSPSGNKLHFNLFCRYLTIDPSIYCEKSLRLIVIPSKDYRFVILLVVFLVFGVLIGLGVLLTLYLRRRVVNGDEGDAKKTSPLPQRQMSTTKASRNNSLAKRDATETFQPQSEASKTVNEFQKPSIEPAPLFNHTFESYENYQYSIYPLVENDIQIQVDEQQQNVGDSSLNNGISSSSRRAKSPNSFSYIPQYEQQIFLYKSENLIN
jgi:hypothetical protein